MTNAQVLVVDHEQDARELLGNMLAREAVRPRMAEDARQGLALLRQGSFQVLFTALRMPDMDGLELVRQALRLCPGLAAVVVTGHAEIGSCIEAMRLGASDYVQKPFTPPVIRAALARALDSRRRRSRTIASHPEDAPAPPAHACCMEGLDDPAVTQSAAMRRVRELVAKIAPSDAPVLVHGEAGAGKGSLARAIHGRSRRAGGPFVHVACGAVYEEEFEARLFGRGGTLDEQEPLRRGAFESARGGTLFLADVDCLPTWAQARLFDALEAGSLRQASGLPNAPLDVRPIASASCDLETAVAENRLHGGLYYLLGVVAIHVPPLRHRREDIKVLAERCLARVSLRQNETADAARYRFTEEAWQCLLNHDWPGNLPELASVVARSVALAEGEEIGTGAIAWAPSGAPSRNHDTISVPLAGDFRQIERHVIREVIQRCQGNKAAAARALGLHRRTLYRMLQHDVAGAGAAE